jgi:predicted TIM-barrel fold metal-dependent hydrolase
MPIVDAQVHIWSGNKPGNLNHRQVESFTKDDLLGEMDAGGVHAALIHPPTSWDPNANELAVAAARQHPDRLAVLGNFPLDRPESRGLLDGWKSRPGMLGLRFTFLQPHQKTWPTDGTIDWMWPAAERAGLPVATMAAGFLPKFAEVAQRHPNLKLIIDHLGRPSGGAQSQAELWANLPEVIALAKYPNVAMKATGAPSYSDQPYPFRDIHDHLHRLYDAFGPARFFWGTDITRMPCSWKQCVTMFTEELPWLKGRDLDLVMGQAVCDWIGWKRAGA